MDRQWQSLRKWLTPGLGIKRWLVLLIFGISFIGIAIAELVIFLFREQILPEPLTLLTLRFLPPYLRIIVAVVVGGLAVAIAVLELNRSILAPFVMAQRGAFIDLKYSHSFRQKGIKLVALGGGTGLPAVLRALKVETNNITAIVTVADDGGSSGRLRRELGVLPPGDLRNNIAALANDEDLMTQLFQYRFGEGGLEGHSFGNLFITAMASITGSMDRALVETARVLAVQGRVLPSTLQDVTLGAEVRVAEGMRRVIGESNIPEAGGQIERVFMVPDNARAYPESIRAILSANLIVIGPGSLYTSIIPNLLISGIPEAIRASSAVRIYVCNVATQDGETDNFTVADHVMALERHAGRGIVNVILANNTYPPITPGSVTHYVTAAPKDHEIYSRYEIYETDLTDPQYSWRHSPTKLCRAITNIVAARALTGVDLAENA
jgi:uncharacterized cofD-like protein